MTGGRFAGGRRRARFRGLSSWQATTLAAIRRESGSAARTPARLTTSKPGLSLSSGGAWRSTCSAHARRDASLPLDALPDPIVDPADGIDPEHEALLADSVGRALLVVLETLTPAERLAYVLHDMFAVPFDEITAILNRSPDAHPNSPAAHAACDHARPRAVTPLPPFPPAWGVFAPAASRCSAMGR